tara:strand:- start:485 stop:1201 length:717 start_codon:yes stop_codon:yes gene_type:complete
MKFGKSIVTDGLIFYIDAANKRSYVSGSTTWNNLIDTVTTASLVGGSTFNSSNGGSIQFNGTDGYADLSNTTPIAPPAGSEDWSLNVWFTLDADTGDVQYVMSSINTGNSDWWYLRTTYSSNEIEFVADDGSNPLADLDSTVATLTNWTNVCVTRDKSANEFKLYVNGAHQETDTATDTTVDSNDEILIGALWGSGGANITPKRGFTNGRVSCVSIYDKSLSASEILQNYNALKDRFI